MLKTLASIIAQEPDFDIVGAATDGRKAVLAAATLAPDLVVVDLHLPHLNGAQVTRCLKQFDGPPVVFIVTSDDSPNSRSLSATAGADAFVVKSGDLHVQLHAKLQEWFGPKTGHAHTPTPTDERISHAKEP
jgi:DNA-binding NarL/FixJ family response regulator